MLLPSIVSSFLLVIISCLDLSMSELSVSREICVDVGHLVVRWLL